MARIGITCQVDEDGGFGLFSNSVRQTAFFLHRLFKENGHAAVLLLGPDSVPPVQAAAIPATSIEDYTATGQDLDLVIVCSRALSHVELAMYRQQGARIVRYIGGSLAMDTSASLIGGPVITGFEDRSDYDAIWMPLSYARTYSTWCEAIYQCPVHVLPPLWYPTFVPQGFGFRERDRSQNDHKVSIGIVESNNTVTHSLHWPLMACFYALDGWKNPHSRIGDIQILNSKHLTTDAHLLAFMSNLGFVPGAETEPRVRLLESMIRPVFIMHQCDLVVTHDIEDGFDHLIFECLFGGYPIVHSSEFITHGYRYNRFDSASAGLQIRSAIENHDAEETKHKFASMISMLQDYAKYEVLL